MVNNVINFLENNTFIVLLIIISSILLSLASKTIRKIISTSILSGLIPLLILILQKLGVQLNGIYSFTEKVMEQSFINLTKIQSLLIEKKELFLCLTNFESEFKHISIQFFDNIYKNIKISFVSLIYFTKTANIKLKCKLENIKIEFTKKINLSSLSFVYRV